MRYLALVFIAALLGLSLMSGRGFSAARVSLDSGGAWLVSSSEGLATLLDGASGDVVGSVRVAPPGHDIAATQTGASAYVVDATQGSVVRVDGGTYERTNAVQFTGGASSGLRVFPADEDLLVVDGVRGLAVRADARTLTADAAPTVLAAQPGVGQTAVDDAGDLWMVDAADGDLLRLQDSGEAVTVAKGSAASSAQLVRADDTLVLAEGGALSAVTGGDLEPLTCSLDLRPGETLSWARSSDAQRVVAAVRERGVVLTGDLTADECATAAPVGEPGDELGEPLELDGLLFVPNRTAGRVAVVEAGTRVIATLDVLDPGAAMELLPGSGSVFYNDVGGHRAGVIRLDGGEWRADEVAKYDPERPGEEILTPATAPESVPASAPPSVVTAEKPAPQTLPSAPTGTSPDLPGATGGPPLPPTDSSAPNPTGNPTPRPTPTPGSPTSERPTPIPPTSSPPTSSPPTSTSPPPAAAGALLTLVVDGNGVVSIGGSDPAVQAARADGTGTCETSAGSPSRTCSLRLPLGTDLTINGSTGSSDPMDMTGCPGTEAAVGEGRECAMTLTGATEVVTIIRIPPPIEPGPAFTELPSGEFTVRSGTTATLRKGASLSFDRLEWTVVDVLSGATVATSTGSSLMFRAPPVGGSGEEMQATLTAVRGSLAVTAEFRFFVVP